MTIVYLAGSIITGLSSDTKPTTASNGSIFIETDTGARYIINSGTWTLLAPGGNLDSLTDVDLTTAAPTNNQVLTYTTTGTKWVPATPPGSGGGEANTTSNVGTGEGTLALAKSGVNLPFKSLKQGTNITLTNNSNDVTISSTGGGGITASSTDTFTNKTISRTTNVLPYLNASKYSIYQDGGAVKVANNVDGSVTSHATLGPAVNAVLADTGSPSCVIHAGTYNLASGFSGWVVIPKFSFKTQGLVMINVPQDYAGRVFSIENSAADVYYVDIEGGIYDEQGTQANNWVWLGITPTGNKAVHNCQFKNVEVWRAQTPLYIRTTDNSWVNQNIFENIYGTATEYAATFDHVGTYTADLSGPNGNKFVNISMQAFNGSDTISLTNHYPQALGGIIGVFGKYNTFEDCMIWDLQAANSSAASMTLTSNADSNRIDGGSLTSRNFTDAGTNNLVTDSWKGVNNKGPTTLAGTNTLSGATTISGNLTVSGTANFTNTAGITAKYLGITTPAIASTGEDLFSFTVADASGDSFALSNSASIDGIFGPLFVTTQNSTAVGTGTVGMYFETRVKASTDTAGANWCNAIAGRRLDGAQMVDRGLLAIYNKWDTAFGFYPTKSDWTTKKLTNFTLPTVSKTSAYTLTDADYAIRADANSAGFTLTLPAAADTDIYTQRTGKEFFIKKIDTTSNIVVIDGNASETLEGLLTWELRQPGDWVKIRSDGTNWNMVERSQMGLNSTRRTGTTSPDTYYIAGQANAAALGTATAVTANQLYSLPFVVDRVQTIDKVGVNVTTGVASSNVRIGIYKDLNGVPGALVADLGIVATTTPAALKEITGLSQKLQPGIYWLSAVFSHTPTLSYLAAAGITSMLGVTSAAAINTAVTASFTYAALPSPHTTPAKSTATSQPALFYHFSG